MNNFRSSSPATPDMVVSAGHVLHVVWCVERAGRMALPDSIRCSFLGESAPASASSAAIRVNSRWVCAPRLFMNSSV